MLNGKDPLIIFHFYGNPYAKALAAIFGAGGVPVLAQSVLDLVGIPIPFYLSEKLTGLVVDSQTRDLRLKTDTKANIDDTVKPTSSQTISSDGIHVSIKCNMDSPFLAAFMAMFNLIVSKVIAQNYKISYFNGTTVVIKGLLNSFSTSENPNDNLLIINFELGIGDQETDAEKKAPNPSALTPEKSALPTGA
jgi:hypothetical protein